MANKGDDEDAVDVDVDGEDELDIDIEDTPEVPRKHPAASGNDPYSKSSGPSYTHPGVSENLRKYISLVLREMLECNRG